MLLMLWDAKTQCVCLLPGPQPAPFQEMAARFIHLRNQVLKACDCCSAVCHLQCHACYDGHAWKTAGAALLAFPTRSSAMAGPEASWEALDKELLSMMDTFANLIKASRMPDEESDQVTMRDNRKDRAPGDLLDIWAEKLIHAGHMALVYVGQLKSQALLSEFDILMNHVRKVRVALGSEDQQVTSELLAIRQEVADMLSQLESSYYSCPHKGRAPALDMSAELKELAVIATELADKPDVLRAAPPDKPPGTK